jgi:hypothetical protein
VGTPGPYNYEGDGLGFFSRPIVQLLSPLLSYEQDQLPFQDEFLNQHPQSYASLGSVACCLMELAIFIFVAGRGIPCYL